MTEETISVVIADDHPSVRAGLRLLLETVEGIEVLGEASDGSSAWSQVIALGPDVVLMDARMPSTDGIEATRRIVAETESDVLMLTTFDVDEIVFGALRAGAAGFLLKSVEPVQLIEAIRQVAAGDGVVAPEVTRRLLRAFASEERTQQPETIGQVGHSKVAAPMPSGFDLSLLTPRELDVLAALGRGLSNTGIADELFISLATVKSHVSSVLGKLQLNSRMQAAICAREAGLA